MKKTLLNKISLLLLAISLTAGAKAQDSVVRESIIGMKYFSVDNKIPYLVIQTQHKLGKKYSPVKNV